MYYKCNQCHLKILRHAYHILCNACKRYYHMKCLTIVPVEIDYLKENSSEWLCETCLSENLPFNNIENQNEFLDTIFCLNHTGNHFCQISEKIFNPIELNEDYNEIDALNDVDPDLNFYNGLQQSINNCKYYLEDVFNEEYNNSPNNEHFSMLHMNIRSVKRHLGQLEAYLGLLDHKFRIIALTESWITDYDSNLYNLPYYELFENHRSIRSGGGVALYIDMKYESKHRRDLDFFTEHCESVFVELDKVSIGLARNVIIGCIYRVPNKDVNSFLDSIKPVLECVRKENKLCYLLGDFNLDLMNSDNHSITGEYLDFLTSYCFFPLINRPTRVTSDTATIIDNIFTNNLNALENSMHGVFVTDISDHYPVFYISFSDSKKSKDVDILKRKYTSNNKQSFLDSLKDISWKSVFDHSTTNLSFGCFLDIIRELHNRHFPKVRIKVRHRNNKSWLSDDLKEEIKYKNKLYKLSKKIPCLRNELIYKTFKNRLQHKIKIEEKNHYCDLFQKYKGNMKRSWSLIKTILYRGSKTKIQNKFALSNGDVVTDRNIICEKFNNFFTGIGPSLANAIPDQDKTPKSYLSDRLTNTIFLYAVTEKEIEKIVTDLNNGAPGYDDIPALILKLALPYIKEPMMYICNLSLLEGVFPECLKIANVVPLFKSGDSMLFNNYRPVSLLSVFSKVFEKVMYSRLSDFLKTHKLLYKYQFGFRKDHSAYMALMILIDKITNCLENGDHVVGVYLDFSKAFDTVNHKILLNKLEHYGIRGPALLWFESYLSDRKQFVTYDNASSNCSLISCGVTQGSILGPLLFLIYINDLNNVCKDAMSIFFADDSNLFLNGKDISKIETELNEILANISEWLKVNKLSLNVKKTHFMIFSRAKSKANLSVNLKIDGENLLEVEKTKFLGVIIDNRLSWRDHVNYISGKIARGIGILIKARAVLNKGTLITLYYSFVYPYYTYCNHIWGSSCSKNIKRLFVLQKKAIRIICHAHMRSNSEPLFREMKLLNVWQINKFLIGQFMYKSYHNLLPPIFDSNFVRTRGIHQYDTRQAPAYFDIIKVRTEYRKASIRFRGPTIWNNLIKNKISPDIGICTFKFKLKNFLLTDTL